MNNTKKDILSHQQKYGSLEELVEANLIKASYYDGDTTQNQLPTPLRVGFVRIMSKSAVALYFD